MKNAIAYYYDLYSYDIHQKNGVYKFTVENGFYTLSPCDITKIYEIYKLSTNLLNMGIYTHQIIPNNKGELYTYINNVNYVLLKSSDLMDSIITYQDIINFTNTVKNLKLESNYQKWNILWETKIDYFEYQLNQFGNKYPLIRESLSYYIGMAETGIMLFKNTRLDNIESCISHRRIKSTSTLFDLYNPLNYVFDYKVRDAAEYFKTLFLEKEDIFSDIVNYISYNYLSEHDCLAFYIRMFYPSFYFDMYEDIMDGVIQEEKIKQAIKKTNQYESLLKNLYVYLSGYINMPDIEWIKNKL